jgi:hypothetical protein
MTVPIIEPFHFAVAIGPLAVYWLLMGYIRWRRQPLVTTGGRDLATLGLSLIGLCAIGPAELFFPRHAASLLGANVWILILTFYGLCVTLVALMARHRLIVYGLDQRDLAIVLQRVLSELDPDARWVADSFMAPGLGIHAVVDSTGASGVAQVSAISNQQDPRGWSRLESALAQQLRQETSRARHVAWPFFLLGLLLLAGVIYMTARDPAATSQAMHIMLRR